MAPSRVRRRFSRLLKLLSDRVSRRRIVKTVNKLRWGPSLLVTGRVLAHPWEYYVRRRAVRRVMTASPSLTVSRAAGFTTFAASDCNEAAAVLDLCRTIYEERRHHVVRPSDTRAKKKKAGHFIELLTDADLIRYPQLIDFCLSPDVVAAVSGYLGTLPILRRVALLLSLPASTDEDSRLFHLDPEDTRQIKIFVNASDVQQGQGPLTFLPADVSSTVINHIRREERLGGKRSLRYRRWMDDEVLTHCTRADLIEHAGPAGAGVLVDTSRYLHFGSRLKPGTYRLVFMAQYLRYHFAFATDANRVEAAGVGRDPLRSRILVDRPGPTPFTAADALRHPRLT